MILQLIVPIGGLLLVFVEGGYFRLFRVQNPGSSQVGIQTLFLKTSMLADWSMQVCILYVFWKIPIADLDCNNVLSLQAENIHRCLVNWGHLFPSFLILTSECSTDINELALLKAIEVEVMCEKLFCDNKILKSGITSLNLLTTFAKFACWIKFGKEWYVKCKLNKIKVLLFISN